MKAGLSTATSVGWKAAGIHKGWIIWQMQIPWRVRGFYLGRPYGVTNGADHTCTFLFQLSQILKQNFKLPTRCCVGSCRCTFRQGRCSSVWIHPSWLSHTSPYRHLLWPVCFTNSIKWFTPLFPPEQAALPSPSLCQWGLFLSFIGQSFS